MRIAYVRVSTREQNVERQEVTMERMGVDRVFIEKQTGVNDKRPVLKETLAYVRDGDTLVVDAISRLARNTKDLLNIVDALTKKGVEFESVKENIDTRTPQGQFMLTIYGAMAQLEIDYSRERQMEGIELAKKKGVYKGRKRIDINKKEFEAAYKQWKKGDITATQAMKLLELKPNTFYRRVKEYEIGNISNG